MSQQVKAAVLREVGGPVAVEEIELAPPGPEEIVVEIEAAGVCHTDVHYQRGDLVSRLPVVLGHEGAGRVIGKGARVSGGIEVGDRVALLWRPNCGRCVPCITGHPVMCERGPVQAQSGGLPDGTSRMSVDGGTLHHLMGASSFSERVVVHSRSVVKVPDDVPADIAAIAGCAVVTGLGAVRNVIGGCAGESLVVFGAGGVGLSAIMGARLAGANPIIAVDVDENKLALARELGATVTIDGRDDVAERIRDATGGGSHWAIEAVGLPQTLQTAVAAARPGGTVVAIGLGRVGQTFEVPVNELVQKQKRLIGSLYGSSIPQVDLPIIFDLYREGRLPLERLLGDSYPLENLDEAFAALQNGALGRSIVRPGGSGR